MSLTGRHEGEQRGDKANAKAREDECSLVVHAVDRLVHRAVLASQRLATAPHRHERRRRRAHQVGADRDGHHEV